MPGPGPIQVVNPPGRGIKSFLCAHGSADFQELFPPEIFLKHSRPAVIESSNVTGGCLLSESYLPQVAGPRSNANPT